MGLLRGSRILTTNLTREATRTCCTVQSESGRVTPLDRSRNSVAASIQIEELLTGKENQETVGDFLSIAQRWAMLYWVAIAPMANTVARESAGIRDHVNPADVTARFHEPRRKPKAGSGFWTLNDRAYPWRLPGQGLGQQREAGTGDRDT